jgi:hypothetical protein
MKLFLIIFTFFIHNIYAFVSSRHDIYAEYCFQKEGYMKLKLSKEIKKIYPISIAKTDSVKCKSDNCGFKITETSFNIPNIKPFATGLWGCASVSFRSVIRTKKDSLTGKLDCDTEYIFDDIMKSYSSLIDIEFPKEKSFVSENDEDLSLEDMRKFVGKEILAEWETKIKCEPAIDTTYSGKYYIRITGECEK